MVRAQSLGTKSKSQIFVTFIMDNLPDIILDMMPRLPMKRFKYLRQIRGTMFTIAAEVMTEKQDDMRKGLEDGRDLMSLLLRANAAEDEHRRMSDEEMYAGITYVQYP